MEPRLIAMEAPLERHFNRETFDSIASRWNAPLWVQRPTNVRRSTARHTYIELGGSGQGGDPEEALS